MHTLGIAIVKSSWTGGKLVLAARFGKSGQIDGGTSGCLHALMVFQISQTWQGIVPGLPDTGDKAP